MSSSDVVHHNVEVPIPQISDLGDIWMHWLQTYDYGEKLKQHIKVNRLKMQKINAILQSQFQAKDITRLPFYIPDELKTNLQLKNDIQRCNGAFLSKTTRFPELSYIRLLASCKKHLPKLLQTFASNPQYQVPDADLSTLGEEMATNIWSDRESKPKYAIKPVIKQDKKPSKKRKKGNANEDQNEEEEEDESKQEERKKEKNMG